MKQILFLAYYFPPIGGAGVQRAQKFARYLPEHGYLPVVITGPVGVSSRWTPRDTSLLHEIPEAVSVHRVAVPAVTSGAIRRRLERWTPLQSRFSEWWVRSAMELALRVGGETAAILATMSPFESGEAAQQIAAQMKAPWIADLRDPWALDEMQVYPTAMHRRRDLRRMESVLGSASLIVMNTPEARSALLAKYPKLQAKPVVAVTNGYDRDDFTGALPERTDGKFRIVHSGYLHTSNGLDLRSHRQRLLGGAMAGVDILTRSHHVLLQALTRWVTARPEIRSRVEVVFAGEATQLDHDFAQASPAGELIRFLGYLMHRDSLELIRTADLLFLPMHNLPPGVRSRIVPGKTYEYMATGRPILGAVPDGDARDFLNASGAARLCRPDDVAGMAKILDESYEAWLTGKDTMRPDRDYIATFERRSLTVQLANALDELLAHSQPRGNPNVGAVLARTAKHS